MCCFSCWLSPPPLECSSWWRAEMNLSAWGCVWGTGRTGLQIFSGANFMSPILLSPYIQKNTKILHGDDCSSWLAKSAKRIVLEDRNNSLDIIYFWNAVSWTIVLILLQIKLWCCVCFFSNLASRTLGLFISYLGPSVLCPLPSCFAPLFSLHL